jgi:hypothetical protein
MSENAGNRRKRRNVRFGIPSMIPVILSTYHVIGQTPTPIVRLSSDRVSMGVPRKAIV